MAENTLRSNLEAAFDAQQKAPEPTPAPDVAPKTTIATEAKPEPIGQPPKVDNRVRDPKTGQYLQADKKPEAPKEKGDAAAPAPGQAKAGGEATATPPVPAPPAEAAPPRHDPAQLPTEKAPASWRPIAREKWAQLPIEVREEWARREKEMGSYVARQGELMKSHEFATTTRQTLAEYAPIARANGMDPMTWAGQALQTVAALYAGTPQQKAQVIAQAIGLAGVDVEAINQAMQSPQAARAAPQTAQPAFDPARIKQDVINELRTESASHKARSFIESEPEFLQDVWPEMVAILKAAEERGQPMDYPEAHQRAIWANPEIRGIIQQREAAKAATAHNAATQRATEAASSIRSTPSSASSPSPKGLRAVLEDAYDKQHR